MQLQQQLQAQQAAHQQALAQVQAQLQAAEAQVQAQQAAAAAAAAAQQQQQVQAAAAAVLPQQAQAQAGPGELKLAGWPGGGPVGSGWLMHTRQTWRAITEHPLLLPCSPGLLCGVCFSETRNQVFVDCGHLFVCEECAQTWADTRVAQGLPFSCPSCNQLVGGCVVCRWATWRCMEGCKLGCQARHSETQAALRVAQN